MPFPASRLYLLFTPEQCTGDPWSTLAMALDGGVDAVQWRVKTEDREGFARCREICQQRRTPLFVNDDVMLAVRSQADGAHVGQEDMPVEAARKLLVGRWLGVSTHDKAQITAAVADGADYVGFGPCYKTATKGYEVGKSRAEIEAAVEEAHRWRLPLFAIGGITPDNLKPLRALGVDRVAVSGWILRSNEPREAAAALRERL
ncbi:MAG TPA: thiamine phosphate synthase [Planctomycetota bacterium]